MKKLMVIVGMFLAAAFSAGVVTASPASADCAPSFTSIPCTIATNVAQAPGQVATGLAVAPLNLAGVGCSSAYKDSEGNATGGSSACGLPSIQNLAGVGCPANDDGSDPGVGSCGLPAVPGQLSTSIANLPGEFAKGGVQIATAPAQIAAGLLAAPGQFASAIQNGGTAKAPDTGSDSGSDG
jgi:hypothetical protein